MLYALWQGDGTGKATRASYFLQTRVRAFHVLLFVRRLCGIIYDFTLFCAGHHAAGAREHF
jgi:hypothetical protein